MSDGRKSDTSSEELLLEVDKRVAVITLNRPGARNALTVRLRRVLAAQIARCGDDPQIGAILFTGAGSAFCAGGDVKAMAPTVSQPERSFEQRVADLQADQRELIGTLVSMRKPTIAAIPGPAAGAGLALALACDIRIAAQSAVLTTAFARIGLSGDYGIAWLLTRAVGYSRACELMFLSERIGAERSRQLGLVNSVVPDADLRESAIALALSLAAGPTLAFGFMKENLGQALTSTLMESLDREAENVLRTELTYDHREGIRAFSYKRAPIFEGR